MTHIGLILVLLAQPADPATPNHFHVEQSSSGPLLQGMPVDLRITAVDERDETVTNFSGVAEVSGIVTAGAGPGPMDDPTITVDFHAGVAELAGVTLSDSKVEVRHASGARGSYEAVMLPGFLTLFPPLLAIVLALATRQVILALFSGVWFGVFVLDGFNPFAALLHSVDTHIIGAIADTSHAQIILFSLFLGGTVGIVSGSGGVQGIVSIVSRYARSPRSGQLSTWLLGSIIFFDDYANTLLVGNTMRPFTDRVRISREKLAFVVDATAAPVATIGIISTWTAYQVGLIGEVLPEVWVDAPDSYLFFLQSIPYSFYSFVMLFLVFLSGLTLRDFGPMRAAEHRCRTTGEVLAKDAKPLLDRHLDELAKAPAVKPRWVNAALPIACVVAFTLAGLIYTGFQAVPAGETKSLRNIMGNADAYRSLLWASVGASIVAATMALATGQKLGEVVDNWTGGAKSLFLAVIILILAWSISNVCKQLHTGDYVASLASGVLSANWIPPLAFLSAGVIAFATGTSYGTMGILIPILLPLPATLAPELTATDPVVLSTLAAILGGAVFGDHCSPISDTTVLSSMASGSDHIDHVRTQLPYALLGASICLPAYTAIGFGVRPSLVLLVVFVSVVVAYFCLARGSGEKSVQEQDA